MTTTQNQEIKNAPKEYIITWEKLPEDYQLPEEPVENILHPLLAAALREALEVAGFIGAAMLIGSNFGLCATVDGKTVIKAPDWFYIPSVSPVESGIIRRSYTPHRDGETPAVVMEFLSENDNGEYSLRPTFPYGKWWFYEQILQVPIYVIFNPDSGLLEVYKLKSGRYEIQQPDANGRYWIESMKLFLGVWQGTKAERTGYWLRWWDESGNLLLWGTERIEQERARAEEERKAKEEAEQRAAAAEEQVAQLMEQLRILRGDSEG